MRCCWCSIPGSSPRLRLSLRLEGVGAGSEEKATARAETLGGESLYSVPQHALSGIVQLAVTPGSGPGDWGSSPCPGVRLRPVNTGRFAFLNHPRARIWA